MSPGAEPGGDLAGRYARQVRVPGVGESGQEKLAQARVLLVGAGGLGSPAGQYLAAAGIGTIGIVDDDRVEVSNLHRQIVHRTADIGRPKVDSAADALRALNPEVTVVTHALRLTPDTVMEVVEGYDVVVDGADSFAARYVVSDACTLLDIPHVWAAVLTDGGQLSVFHASHGPVYRDLLPVMPPAGAVPSCAAAGVLGTVPGVLGTAMAGEVLKLVLGIGRPAIGRVLVYDMLTAEWETVPLVRSPRVTRPQTAADVGRGVPRQVSATQLGAAPADVVGSVGASESPPNPRGTGERFEGRARSRVRRTSHASPAEYVGREPEGPGTGGAVGPPTLISDGPRTLIVDVRTPAEAADGMIPGARLLPLDRIASDPGAAAAQMRAWAVQIDAESLTDTVDVYIHCHAGARSARALDMLGPYAEVDDSQPPALRLHDVVGGYEAWVRAFPDQCARPEGGAGPE
ncbi:HesA/MoeB/ThiF family protein [Brevibacterium jeotgali]|uniref:HesA/MoeB/ThiF family protein n=1 Tax=Brevibacterium jeotgali TaxID=1262550 RepID=UPI0015E0B233|nr:HesA/MoeB/ThiF family protein [Brevibacterium jeotgali]